MDVIRHYHKRIQFYIWIVLGQIIPTKLRKLAKRIQPYLSIDYFAKQTLAIVRANGNKIRARPRVIVIAQTDRTAMLPYIARHCQFFSQGQNSFLPVLAFFSSGFLR